MRDAFEARKPWAAVIVALIFGPIIGMCYLRSARLAVAYLVASIVLLALPFAASHAGLSPFDPIQAASIVAWGLNIVGAIHAFRIAKAHDYPGISKLYSRWHALLGMIAIPTLIAVGFRHFCYEPFDIPTSAMSPNVNQGDYLFAQKFAYNSRSPTRGEIIIFKIDNTAYIKRVIGLPGDRIQLKDGVPYINGDSAAHRADDDTRGTEELNETRQLIEKLPSGEEYKIIMDSSTSDINNTSIYTVSANSYFVLGDNRDHSKDSRYQNFGLIPRQNVIGKALVIIWSDSTRKLKWEAVNPD